MPPPRQKLDRLTGQLISQQQYAAVECLRRCLLGCLQEVVPDDAAQRTKLDESPLAIIAFLALLELPACQYY